MQTKLTMAGSTRSPAHSGLLQFSAQTWFVIAFIGQLLFTAYVALFYGGSAYRGDMEAWNKVFPRGFVPGDHGGNAMVAVHILLAVLINLGGALQFIPKIRSIAPRFHRWNGRVYLFSVFFASLAGLLMVWGRGAVGGLIQHIGISLNAVLIMLFAGLTLRYALARDFVTHRRWALRLFMVASGVWFFRISIMLWIIINQGPAGFDPVSFEGPFLYFLSFANYLIPLLFAEVYLRVKAHGTLLAQRCYGVVLLLLSVMTLGGVAAATMLMWLPRVT